MQAESFDYRPSKILIFLLIVVHVGSLVIIACMRGHIFAQLLGGGLCLFSFIWNINLQLNVKKILWNEKTGWKVQDRKGAIYPANLNKQNVCTPWVAGLNFNKKPLIIFFDSMRKDAFRRLRVLLANGRANYEN